MSLDGPAILFVDLDGTVRHGKDELGRFVNEPADVHVFPDAVQKMRKWRDKGGVVIGVTNQGGVGLGYMTEQTNDRIEGATLAEADEQIVVVFTCTHRPDDGCFCRKPLPGLILRGVEWSAHYHGKETARRHCLMVGDRDEDQVAAHAAGIEFQWAAEWRDAA